MKNPETKNLEEFLAFIRDNMLEKVARESLRISREMDIPLMKLFANVPDEAILPRSMKSLTEFSNYLSQGIYIKKQKENLKNWEDDKLEGVSKGQIQPVDLVLVYAAQKKALHKFIPHYTSDPEKIVAIVNELEDIHSMVQNEAISMMFRWRQETEAALTESNHFLDAVLENIPNMIFVKDANELRFVRFNKAGEELVGLTREKLIGKNDYDFFPKSQAEFFTSNDRNVLAQMKLCDISEEPIDTFAKGQRLLHTKKIPIVGKDGKPAYLLGISEDITEQKKREKEVLQLNQELEAFTYSVSHDLRAPLRAVNGYANMLEEDYGQRLDEEGKRLLKIIRYNAAKMGTLIDDLLSFSRLGRKELNRSMEDMNLLVEGVLFEVNKNISHHAKIVIGKLHNANVDYALMHQAFYNIISNAIKYSAGKAEPVVQISSEETDKEIIFRVKDNGVGFDMKYAGKLFGVFQRLHTSEEFEGTGVGLAIVKRITTKHHGRVWAEAAVNEGATFFIALPANTEKIKPNSNGKFTERRDPSRGR